MRTLERDKTISQIVEEHPVCARTLEGYGIDAKRLGARHIEEACRFRGIDPTTVWAALEFSLRQSSATPSEEVRELPTEDLIAIIVSKHHAYLRYQLPFLRVLSSKVAAAYGDKNANLYILERSIRELADRILAHIEMEERVLFPAFLLAGPGPGLHSNDVAYSVAEDHRMVASVLRQFRSLTDDFTWPDCACGNYHTLMEELGALEEDLVRHLNLENQVLMPRFRNLPRR